MFVACDTVERGKDSGNIWDNWKRKRLFKGQEQLPDYTEVGGVISLVCEAHMVIVLGCS